MVGPGTTRGLIPWAAMIDHGRGSLALVVDTPESSTMVNRTKPFRATFHSLTARRILARSPGVNDPLMRNGTISSAAAAGGWLVQRKAAICAGCRPATRAPARVGPGAPD